MSTRRQRNILVLALLGIVVLLGALLTVRDTAEGVTPQPTGVPGTWSMVFDDEFDGTALDTTKWDPHWFLEGGVINDVPTYARNINVVNGRLFLRLHTETDGSLTGAAVRTAYTAGRYQVMPGDFVESRILFAGSSTEDIYNWPAFWASGQNWPAAGENDIAEGLGGLLKVTYHYKDATGAAAQKCKVTPPGTWGNTFHTFGLWRQATQTRYYWDGVLVDTCATSDNGGPEEVILNVGKPRSPDTRAVHTEWANSVRVEYVRAWR